MGKNSQGTVAQTKAAGKITQGGKTMSAKPHEDDPALNLIRKPPNVLGGHPPIPDRRLAVCALLPAPGPCVPAGQILPPFRPASIETPLAPPPTYSHQN